MQENREQGTETFVIEGRNAVLEAFRSGRTIDKIYVLDGCQDGPVRTIVREAKKHGSLINFVTKERLSQLSETGEASGGSYRRMRQHMNILRSTICLSWQKREAKLRF